MQAAAAADAALGLGRGKTPGYSAGMGGGWQAVGPAHKQRYLRYDPAASSSGGGGDEAGSSEGAAVGALLAQIRDELFTSAAFARLLKKVSVPPKFMHVHPSFLNSAPHPAARH